MYGSTLIGILSSFVKVRNGNKMSRFVLEIDLGNEMMSDSKDVATALRQVALRIERNQYAMDEELVRGIMDENGNTCGSWRIDP
jgi:hypothetical protein